MGIEERIEKIVKSYMSISNAKSFSDLVTIINNLFNNLSYSANLVTGIPLPNQPLKDLIIIQQWNLNRSLVNRTLSNDICILKAIDWTNSFVLKKDFLELSVLSTSAQFNVEKHAILITPIHSVTGYQGVVINQFEVEPFCSHCNKDQLISYSERNIYYSTLNYAFARMAQFNPTLFIRKGELSRREKEVVSIAALGNTSLQIAQNLGIKERTVICHIQNASRKLAVNNRTECVLQAIRYRQIGPGAGFGFYQLENEVFPTSFSIHQS